MGLFKKSSGVPDVGQEELFEQEKAAVEDSHEEDVSDIAAPMLYHNNVNSLPAGDMAMANSQLEINKLNAKIESITEWIKQFYERFSYVSESIGGIRAMAMNNEKSISKISLEAEKAFDIVKEVKPEVIRIDYQKLDARLVLLEGKLASNEQFSDTVMSEIKDLRKKAEMFMGTDALLQLNEEIKKDLIDLQKLASRVRVNSDRSEQLFIELRKGFAENQKLNKVFANLDASYGGLQNEISKLKIDYSNIIKRDEFSDFRKNIENKIIGLENSYNEIKKIKSDNERLTSMVETILAISKRNEDDIGKLAVSVGDDRIKKVSDYEERLNTLLSLVEKMSLEITRLRKKLNLKPDDLDREILKESELLEESILKSEDVKNDEKIVEEKIPVKKANEVKEFKSSVANQILEEQKAQEEDNELSEAEKRLNELEQSNVVPKDS